jgi:FAD/FMN-containing dehydrogenase
MGVRTKDLDLGRGVDLTGSSLDRLRRTFRGSLVSPDEPHYDATRRVHNAMVDHRPALIARCLGAADVASTIAFAREQGVDVSVRAGGHSIVGHSTMGVVVVDLSLMRGVRVDAPRQRAHVQGGAMFADLDRETQHFGLATTGGLVTSTGVGGLTLGGGYGWLARRFGLACDNLRWAEVVTADGAVIEASREHNPDLFWALRGGGGNFGVVTVFEFGLRPFGPAVTLGDIFYRADDGLAALRSFRDLLVAAPDDLYLAAGVAIASEAMPVPEEWRGTPIVNITWAWVGESPDGGTQLAAPLHRAGTPIAETVTTLPYVELQTGPGLERPPRRLYWKSSFLPELSDDLLGTFLEATIDLNGGRDLIHGEMLSMGGTIARVSEDEAAYAHRDALVDFLAVAGWQDPAEDDLRLAAGRELWRRVAGVGGRGVYVNNLGSEGHERVREAYGPAKYERLAAIKARYDPENVFHHNANILPAR